MNNFNTRDNDSPQLAWRELLRNTRFAIGQSWEASPGLVSGMFVVLALSALVPVLFAIVAGILLGNVKSVFAGEAGYQLPLVLSLASVAGLMLVEVLAGIGRKYINARLNDVLRQTLSVKIAEHFAGADLAFFEDPESQNVIERAGNQPGTEMIRFINALMTTITQGFQAASLAAVLIYIEPVFTPLVVLASIPLLLFRWHMAKLTYATQRKQATVRRWSNYYLQLLKNRTFVPTVKLYNLAPELIQQFSSYLGQIIGVNARLYRKAAIGQSIASVIITAAAMGLIFWVGYRTVAGELSIEKFGTFVVALNRIQASIQMFVDATANSLERILFVSNLAEVFQNVPKIREGTLRPETLPGNIELHDVRFTYPGSANPVIKNVSIVLKAGKTTALLGPNGCGKTTLTRLITRLYDVDGGRILIGGHDIRDLSATYLRNQIAFVSQNPVCFEATVRDNIAYGNWPRLAEEPEAVNRIAEDANIADMIKGFPDEFDTLIGRQFGTFDISTGQWQKLTLARALARDAPIVILDEPTASMDAHSEAEMYAGFQNLAVGKTTLLISHRFSTVAMADYIYIMDDGRIVDHGKHDELLQRGGIYSAMYEVHHRMANSRRVLKTI